MIARTSMARNWAPDAEGEAGPGVSEPSVDAASKAGAATIRLAEADWFRRVGELASSIGTDRFHKLLVELLGATIPHSASWIIRYSRVAPPDVIFTANVSQEVVDFYVADCSPLDPFSAHWKRYEQPGVRTLASFSARDATIDPRPYSRLFKAAANVTDELGVFFSTVGHSSLGLFLEREKGLFTKAEVERTERAFPVLDGFHKAHVGRIFDRLRYAGDAVESELITRPTLVQDRCGLEIFSTETWREAAAADAAIVEATEAAGDGKSIDLPGHTLKIERFDDYFPLAPSGRMFVLTPRGKPAAVEARPEPDLALTARERAIFDLMMAGATTGAIAQALRISKGTVKNVKLRIYRKTGVASERALMQKFARPAAGS